MLSDDFAPIFRDFLEPRLSSFIISRMGSPNLSGDFYIVPISDEIIIRRIVSAHIPYAGEHELIAQCRNFAERVVWRFSEPRAGRYHPTIGGNNNFILPEIYDYNRSRWDLGQCRIDSKNRDHGMMFHRIGVLSGGITLRSWIRNWNAIAHALAVPFPYPNDLRAWYEILAIRPSLQNSRNSM
jgi:hypothetical protein